MAQNFTPDWYELTYVVDTAFQNAENNDNALRSNFSGSTAPSSPIAGQQWFDIDTGTMKVYEIDSQWIASLVGGTDFKTWLYTNDQQRGMLIDNSVGDVVLALRGGNYGANGGVALGDWTITGLSNANAGNHKHEWKEFSGGIDYTWNSAGNLINVRTNENNRNGIIVRVSGATDYSANIDFFTSTVGEHSHTITHNASDRPLAAVGTMQYPNLA